MKSTLWEIQQYVHIIDDSTKLSTSPAYSSTIALDAGLRKEADALMNLWFGEGSLSSLIINDQEGGRYVGPQMMDASHTDKDMLKDNMAEVHPNKLLCFTGDLKLENSWEQCTRGSHTETGGNDLEMSEPEEEFTDRSQLLHEQIGQAIESIEFRCAPEG